MVTCRGCGAEQAAEAIGYCVHCVRNSAFDAFYAGIHSSVRQQFGLPPLPPDSATGKRCTFCSNRCRLEEDEIGFCGLRRNRKGRIVNTTPQGYARAHIYLDPLPSNCCAAWFCPGSRQKGFNLAVFFYGCNFNCLFCQNDSHKQIDHAPMLSVQEIVAAALDPLVRCVCFFGGSPEPQLPFAINAARQVIETSANRVHICWEWNGAGNPSLVRKAVELAHKSGGTVKFDLKASHRNLSYALCGVSNRQVYLNFARMARRYPVADLLTATTLLVPYYIDREEVAAIARFLAHCNPEIPYSLLVFHPDFFLRDLPVTPGSQVQECYTAATSHLRRVHIGNEHLLS